MSADVHRSPLTPTAFLERTAAVFPDRVGIVDGDLRLTWAELAERARRLAVALQEAGIERGDRVAFLALNAHELLEAHFGVPAAGAVLVAVNSRLMEDEVAYILEHSGSRLLVVDTALEAVGAAAAARAGITHVRVCGPGAPADGERSYEALLAGAGAGAPEPRLGDEDDVISVNYTSGTTGRPKGVMYTHRGAYLNALGEAIAPGWRRDSVYLWTLPLFHCNGWCFPWAVTAAAARHVCCARSTRPRSGRLLAERARHALLRRADRARDARRGPRREARGFEPPVRVATGGRPPSPTLLARMEAARRPGHPRLRADRDLRAAHHLRAGSPDWEQTRRRGARRGCMARQGVPLSRWRPRARASTTRCATCPPTRRRWARS